MSEQPIAPTMLMVGGTGRCGTSITKEIIGRHPQAASLPFEYRFIIDPDGLVDFYASYTATWSPYLADLRLRRLERLLRRLAGEPLHHKLLGSLIKSVDATGKSIAPRAYHGWELRHYLPSFDRDVERLMSRLVEFSFPACWVGTGSYELWPHIRYAPPMSRGELAAVLGDFIESVVSGLLEQTGKSFLVEDNTWNILFAKELLEILPNAKIIHVYRDPRDVVASFSQQRWSPTDKEQAARWYRAIITHWFAVRSALPPKSYREFSLEELVSKPEEIVRKVCDFADIDYHERMVQIDLSHSHTGRWKREFSKQEKSLVQDILWDIIVELGYES